MAHADLLIHNAGVYEFGANAALRQRMQAANVDGTDNRLGLASSLVCRARSMSPGVALTAKKGRIGEY